MAAIDYAGVVQQLYVTYFGRPADYFGLQNFEAQLAALNAPTNLSDLSAAVQANPTSGLAQLVNSFSVSTESTNLYGSDNTEIGVSKFVEAIYLNLLGRAPDVDGWKFWTDAILSGNLSRANAAAAIADGALHNTTTQGLADAATINNKVTVATNFTNALDTVAEINGFSGDTAAATARSLLANVTNVTDPAAYQATVESTIATIVTQSIPSVTQALTTGVDTAVGTAGNDVFTATLGTGATLTTLDSIDGKGGSNTLKVSDLDALGSSLPAITLTNVQNVEWVAAGVVNNDFSTLSGVTSVNISQSNGTDVVTVGSGTAVSVVDTAGKVTVHGGTSQTVHTAGGVILDKATGAITAVDTAQGIVNSTIDNGTSVSLVTSTALDTTANTAGTIGKITIGGVKAPTGAVSVTDNLTGDTAGDTFGGAITINGGTTVNVVVNATQAAAASTGTNYTVTQGDVTVNGGATTTSVAVSQTAAAGEVDTADATAAVAEVDTVTFAALAAGATAVVGGLTFTAGAAGTTAAQTAAAFANLAAGATQGSSTLGTYSGSLSANYSSAAASSAAVVFTQVAGTAGAIAATGPTVVRTTHGVDAVAGTAGVGGIVDGKVTVVDSKFGTGTNTIASVTLNAYGASSVVQSDALTSLSLSNTDATALTVSNNTATTLGLTLNKVTGASALDLDGVAGTYTTLNVHGATADSAVAITASGVQALTIDGTQAIDLTGSAFAALQTVVISGAAGVTTDANTFTATTVTDVNASATTGNNTVTVNAAKATFEGGSGNDTVTVTGAISKAISLGAGDDTLVISGVTSATAVVDGGTGTDTLKMDAVSAATASQGTAFATKFTGFEHLTLTGATTNTIDLAALGNYSYVTADGYTALTLNNMASGGTLVVDAATVGGNAIVGVTNASTGTADVLNVVATSHGSSIDAGTVTAAKVETINLAANDTKSSDAAGAVTYDLKLVATSATTIHVTGNGQLSLDTTGNTAVTTIDASAMTGGITVTAAGTVAETIKGGAGGNTLTASTGNLADTLIGGAGNDTLTANAGLDTLTGGGGHDTFVIGTPSANVNSYATITDAAKGDMIEIGGATTAVSFALSKIVLADTANFQAYADAAVTNVAIGTISWFQFGGNTYVVENAASATETAFNNGTDFIVKLTGNVDLSHTSLNTDHGVLLIG